MRDESLRADQSSRAQRRDVTVLFADLVGSTELARQLDLEAYHRVMSRFLQLCAERIAETGGYVARFMGDGVLAYFGFPEAHEDDAARAITASMAIRDSCARLGEEVGTPLLIRCGIASGGAILGIAIGTGDAREVPVFGDVANLAARLQVAAQPGSILVAPVTHKRTEHRFSFTRSLRLQLNGFPEVYHGWEVTGRDSARYRPWAGGRPERARLIGRDAERTLFTASWIETCAGRGGALVVSGEAGVGKTRLIQDWARLAARAQGKPRLVAADPLCTQTPLHLIGRLFEILPGAGHVAGWPDESLYQPALASTEVPRDDGHLRAAMLVRAVLDRFDDAPTLLVIEDIHWADPSSLEVLDGIAYQIVDRPILMVTTSRVQAPEAPVRSGLRSIRLAPLTEAQTHELVASVAGTLLSGPGRDGVVKRSGGVPLFAEELTRLMLLTPDPANPRSIPETLGGLLLARLTTLGPAMALAQCAAILGVEAPIAALEALAARRGIDMTAGLKTIQQEGVAVVSGKPAALRFQHALYRDAALETLLSADRQSLYRDVAELLEESPIKIIPDAALAEFWREAGVPERALEALGRATVVAQEQRAWRETRQLVQAALTLLRGIPQGQRGVKRELALQTLLAEALQITVGYSSPAARAAAADAQRLAERAGEIDQSLVSVAGKWMAASSAGDYRRAQAIAARALSLAQLHGGPDALAAAHMIDMTTRYRMGDLTGAEAIFQAGNGFFSANAFISRAGAIPQTFGNAALIAVLRGDSAAARCRSAHALRVARRHGATYDRCFAAYMVAMVEVMLGADRNAAALGMHALRLAGTLGFPQFEAIARIVIGRARAGLGEIEPGMAMLRHGLAAMVGTHSRNAQTLYLTWLAEAALSGGDTATAVETTEAALSINADELFYRPETLRIRALALLGRGAAAEAEAAFHEGEALAVTMQAPWFTDRMKPLKVRLGLS